MKEASFYIQLEGKITRCYLCNHNCIIKDGKKGICGVRENRDGKLYSLVYGKIVSRNIDPIEKKPLFHVLPGSLSYSISTVGCNFKCEHCQNYQISQYPHMCTASIIGDDYTPEAIVAQAKRNKCESISYTYVEPTIFYEFAYDCAVIARKEGIKNVFVSNGYMGKEVTHEIAPVLDAINIDIKAFSESFYKKICKGTLAPVLDNVKLMHDLGVWVEITTLIIPGLNDSEKELRDIASFIKNIDTQMPWHVTGFHPTYKMLDRPYTPIATLERAREIGLEEGLAFVFEGNRPGEGGENSYCPKCRSEEIKRFGFTIISNKLKNGSCSNCGTKIPGIWS